MTEVFKPIDWAPGYQVSNMGQVRGPRKMLRPLHNKAKDTYHVCLHVGVMQLTRPIHRLVLETFVGPCPEGMESCHNDGDRANNQLDNLRWDTHGANEADKIAHGTVASGSRNGSSKASDDDVRAIRQLASEGVSHSKIAVRFGLGRRTVSHMISGNTWKASDE